MTRAVDWESSWVSSFKAAPVFVQQKVEPSLEEKEKKIDDWITVQFGEEEKK